MFLWSDTDECAKNNGGCDSNRKCTNTDGGRTCGDCSAGWANDGVTGCKGLYMLLNICFHQSATLSSLFIFTVLHLSKSKFRKPPLCSDINECASNNGGCDSKRKCINSAGGMKCGDCPDGWDNDGDKGCKGSSLVM